MDKRKNNGGKRENSGRKKRPETEVINFRLPKGQKKELKEKYPDLSKRFKSWVRKLLNVF